MTTPTDMNGTDVGKARSAKAEALNWAANTQDDGFSDQSSLVTLGRWSGNIRDLPLRQSASQSS